MCAAAVHVDPLPPLCRWTPSPPCSSVSVGVCGALSVHGHTALLSTQISRETTDGGLWVMNQFPSNSTEKTDFIRWRVSKNGYLAFLDSNKFWTKYIYFMYEWIVFSIKPVVSKWCRLLKYKALKKLYPLISGWRRPWWTIANTMLIVMTAHRWNDVISRS